MGVALPFGPNWEGWAPTGTRDCRGAATLLIAASLMASEAETEATSAACALRSWLPAVPVTTTSDWMMTDWAIWMLRAAVAPALTRIVSCADL